MNILLTNSFIGFPASNVRAWISTKEWNSFPNIPSGPIPDPDIPSPEPGPEPEPEINETVYKV